MVNEVQKRIISQMEKELQPDAPLNNQERRDFYKELLLQAKKPNLGLIVDLWFEGLEFSKIDSLSSNVERWHSILVQFFFSGSREVETCSVNLVRNFPENTDIKELSHKCELADEGSDGVICRDVEIEEAVDITETYFEKFFDIPEKAKPTISIGFSV